MNFLRPDFKSWSITCYNRDRQTHYHINSTEIERHLQIRIIGYISLSHVYSGCLALKTMAWRIVNFTYHLSVEWLIANATDAPVVCISRLSGSVELTLRNTTPDIRCRHRRYECDGGTIIIDNINVAVDGMCGNAVEGWLTRVCYMERRTASVTDWCLASVDTSWPHTFSRDPHMKENPARCSARFWSLTVAEASPVWSVCLPVIHRWRLVYRWEAATGDLCKILSQSTAVNE